MKEPRSHSPPPAEDEETVENTEANSPSEDVNTSDSKRSSKVQQNEALTTAHLHYRDEEQLSSMQAPEEENEQNYAKEFSS